MNNPRVVFFSAFLVCLAVSAMTAGFSIGLGEKLGRDSQVVIRHDDQQDVYVVTGPVDKLQHIALDYQDNVYPPWREDEELVAASDKYLAWIRQNRAAYFYLPDNQTRKAFLYAID